MHRLDSVPVPCGFQLLPEPRLEPSAGSGGEADAVVAERHSVHIIDVPMGPTGRPAAERDHLDQVRLLRRNRADDVVERVDSSGVVLRPPGARSTLLADRSVP
jgi:hypothetical protein